MDKKEFKELFERNLVTPERAKEIRFEAGLSQPELANILCCSPCKIRRWENGRSCKGGYLTGGDSFVLRAIECFGLEAVINRVKAVDGKSA